MKRKITIPCPIATKRIKYLGVNITKWRTCITRLLKETEEGTERWKDILYSWFRNINIVKMAILPTYHVPCLKKPRPGNINWFSHYGNSMEVPPKLKIELWPSNSTSGHVPAGNKTLGWRDVCTPTPIAALFTAKKWKLPKCASVDEWIRKTVYAYTPRGIVSDHKNKVILTFANIAGMNLEGRTYTKWNESDRERQIPCDLIYMWNLKKQWPHRNRTRLVVARGGGLGWAKGTNFQF